MDTEALEYATDLQWSLADALRKGDLYDHAHSDDRYELSETDRQSEAVEKARLTP
jgi:thiamine biosynthesis protein ThiC